MLLGVPEDRKHQDAHSATEAPRLTATCFSISTSFSEIVLSSNLPSADTKFIKDSTIPLALRSKPGIRDHLLPRKDFECLSHSTAKKSSNLGLHLSLVLMDNPTSPSLPWIVFSSDFMTSLCPLCPLCGTTTSTRFHVVTWSAVPSLWNASEEGSTRGSEWNKGDRWLRLKLQSSWV